ncbi:PKD domain-containing protein [Thermoflavifilum thermophilum]|uniref:Gliding motility-associated C-terminal domain-containing protein n=1 Tax=Thermoflavifilum thermophilum TaxID=1393122 RepID=A0A1I7N404_9BACT|nr:PKD domain-containing protein [Thermoflavifilum thermophilum]SFV29381.1 gliding motility-associated C-terminal domain-containing protein [Thermoflavifilum thermophilum]
MGLRWIWVVGLMMLIRPAIAHHIIGGVLYYDNAGTDANGNHRYIIHLRLYRGCEPVDNNHADLDSFAHLTIYDNDNPGKYYMLLDVPMNKRDFRNDQHVDPCIVNPPTPCYQIGYYDAVVSLPVNDKGYTVVYQRCCRNDLIVNAYLPRNGATYFVQLPGRETGAIGDNSPRFDREEAILICANGKFSYDYSAVDPDGDSLSYSFAPAYDETSTGDVAPVVASPPPYTMLPYVAPYSPAFPMGSQVTIDPKTGIISGIAPPAGTYVIAVQVNEYRNGKLIGFIFKDFHLDVTNCHRIVTASIPTAFNKCESFTIPFTNNSTPGRTYLWDFGDGSTSTAYIPTHTYADTGTYVVKLKVDPGSACGDSASSVARVYPVLKPRFSFSGQCTSAPTQFTDLSTSTSGAINYWRWDFGTGDTSALANPQYQFKQANTYPVVLTVGNDKGCMNADTQQVLIYQAPPISLTPDTDLCYRDTIALPASTLTPGSFSWTPVYNLLNPLSSAPLSYARKDTTYYVRFTDANGCWNVDSIRVRVRDSIQVMAAPDTTICTGDPVNLSAVSDGRYVFTWEIPPGQIIAHQQDTSYVPAASSPFVIHARLQSCTAQDTMQVRLVNYPVHAPFREFSICSGDSATLTAANGVYYAWNPASNVDQPNQPVTTAHPADTTLYVVSKIDTLGCPKPTFDSIQVDVIPPVKVFAGNDTLITLGESFMLHGTSNVPGTYTWSPADGLSDVHVPNPIASGTRDITYTLKVSTPVGCYGVDSIRVRYLKGPAIYVPTAFTPNGDGHNDVLRPFPVGIVKLDYFRVYNRWGELVFETSQYLQGWDGYYKGKPADPGGYVWVVKGEDERGRTVLKKGVAVLIR